MEKIIMECRLYMRLSDKEIKTLQYTKDVVIGASSLRSMIMSLCDSELVKRLCFVSLMETQLRRISVNLRQIERRCIVVSSNVELIVCDLLDTLIDIFSNEVSNLRSGGRDGVYRHDYSVRMTEEEKAAVAVVKRSLRFRNYRSL